MHGEPMNGTMVAEARVQATGMISNTNVRLVLACAQSMCLGEGERLASAAGMIVFVLFASMCCGNAPDRCACWTHFEAEKNWRRLDFLGLLLQISMRSKWKILDCFDRNVSVGFPFQVGIGPNILPKVFSKKSKLHVASISCWVHTARVPFHVFHHAHSDLI